MSEVDESKPHLHSLIDGEMYALEADTIIGRHADCGIVLDKELGASRKHARFTVVDQNVFVTDLGSLNGTLVNGTKIENEAQLSDGDILIFDKNEYKVSIPSQSAVPETDPDRTVFVNREDMSKRQLSKPDSEKTGDILDDVDAAAAKDTAAAQQNGPEVSPEIADRVVPEPEPTPPEPAVSAPVINRPGSWANSADVHNSGGTMIAPGVVAMSAKGAPVDLTSISEPSIVVLSGENAGMVLPLVGDQIEWSIGSSTDRNLRITQEGVSGNHAAIIQEGSKWKLVDQMSINGTFVNDNRANVRFIDNDDLLRFGPVECRFVVPANYVGSKKSRKNRGNGFPVWKIAALIATLVVLAVAFYLYSSGLISLPTSPESSVGTQ